MIIEFPDLPDDACGYTLFYTYGPNFPFAARLTMYAQVNGDWKLDAELMLVGCEPGESHRWRVQGALQSRKHRIEVEPGELTDVRLEPL